MIKKTVTLPLLTISLLLTAAPGSQTQSAPVLAAPLVNKGLTRITLQKTYKVEEMTAFLEELAVAAPEDLQCIAKGYLYIYKMSGSTDPKTFLLLLQEPACIAIGHTLSSIANLLPTGLPYILSGKLATDISLHQGTPVLKDGKITYKPSVFLQIESEGDQLRAFIDETLPTSRLSSDDSRTWIQFGWNTVFDWCENWSNFCAVILPSLVAQIFPYCKNPQTMNPELLDKYLPIAPLFIAQLEIVYDKILSTPVADITSHLRHKDIWLQHFSANPFPVLMQNILQEIPASDVQISPKALDAEIEVAVQRLGREMQPQVELYREIISKLRMRGVPHNKILTSLLSPEASKVVGIFSSYLTLIEHFKKTGQSCLDFRLRDIYTIWGGCLPRISNDGKIVFELPTPVSFTSANNKTIALVTSLPQSPFLIAEARTQ